ncbi:GNAT family N-acetyltransferase [Arthrobacter citreus]|uniref:GNAT family N-acetyltransferase n=1 Tax=Arthrobacter TaxID=1663 RepID=UPI001FECB44D|nr:GNAT family N-acetyltransferase [Arthrobacter gandavensis]
MRNPPVHAIRAAEAGDLELLPPLEAASDTLLTGVPGLLDSGMADVSGPRGSGAEAPAAGADPLTLPPPATAAELASALHLLVAGTPPVGFARLEEVDGQAHLEQLSVHPDAAGAGVGRALVEAALAWARTRGYTSMTLCTFAGVPFNAPFYATCGFVVVRSPGGELAGLRGHEKQLGLDALGERIAMRADLDSSSRA